MSLCSQECVFLAVTQCHHRQGEEEDATSGSQEEKNVTSMAPKTSDENLSRDPHKAEWPLLMGGDQGQHRVATPHEWGSGTTLEHRLEARAWTLPREQKLLWHLSTSRCDLL